MTRGSLCINLRDEGEQIQQKKPHTLTARILDLFLFFLSYSRSLFILSDQYIYILLYGICSVRFLIYFIYYIFCSSTISIRFVEPLFTSLAQHGRFTTKLRIHMLLLSASQQQQLRQQRRRHLLLLLLASLLLLLSCCCCCWG